MQDVEIVCQYKVSLKALAAELEGVAPLEAQASGVTGKPNSPHKIEHIKYVRERTQAGMASARKFVEALYEYSLVGDSAANRLYVHEQVVECFYNLNDK